MNTAFKSTCPLWGTPAEEVCLVYNNRPSKFYDSPRCGGKFTVSHEASFSVGRLEEREKARLTTWLVDERRQGNPIPVITMSVLDRIPTMRPMSIAARRDRLLVYLSQKGERLGAATRVASSLLELMAWTEAIDEIEFRYVMDFAIEEELIKRTANDQSEITITPKGYAHLEQLSGRNPDSAQAFVAMWFDDSMTPAYEEGFKPAIDDAGYKPLRIDRKEHINKIDDEIIAEIRRSRFVVADFTSEPDKPRGGVYFEAGFAQGLGIPVVWTCRQDAINSVHFDTRQFNHIVWATTADLRPKLKIRIEAVIGDGPLKGHKSE